MEITYEKIKPLIVSETLEGNQVKLKFQAKNQEAPFETVGVVVPDQDEIMKDVAKQAVKRTIISRVASAIGGLFGGTGRMVSNVAVQASNVAMSSQPLTTKVTPEKQQKVVVEAFSPFQSFYKFDDTTGEWEYIQPGS
ncbi:MAG: hypothetical protein J7L46_03070 [Bacteroidales bacterium]|nr:hypothetical protein [Bacteroidales bacterium]